MIRSVSKLLVQIALAASIPFGSAARAQVAAHLTPAQAEAAFRQATDACLKDDHSACIEGYQRLLAEGFRSADLNYNLGTAYLRQGKLGYAILYLQRAVRLDPSDADAQANLEKAARMRIDQLVGTPEETGSGDPLASRIALHTRLERWTLAFLLLWVLGSSTLLLRRFFRAPRARRVALALGLSALAPSLPSAAVIAAHAWVRERAHEAVVVAAGLPVREGPSEGFKASFEVHEGLKVRILDQDGAFKRIRLANGLQGWVSADGVLEISAD